MQEESCKRPSINYTKLNRTPMALAVQETKMEEDNNIDNLFRSVVEPFEVEPPEKVWSSLDSELTKRQAAIQNKRRNRRFFLILLTFLAASVEMYIVFAPSRS